MSKQAPKTLHLNNCKDDENSNYDNITNILPPRIRHQSSFKLKSSVLTREESFEMAVKIYKDIPLEKIIELEKVADLYKELNISKQQYMAGLIQAANDLALMGDTQHNDEGDF
jgi:hypothetical protein